MPSLREIVASARDSASLLPQAERASVAKELRGAFPKLDIYEASVFGFTGGLVAAARDGSERRLLVCGRTDGFEGAAAQAGETGARVCQANAANMARLRKLVSWLNPQLVGARSSVGLGDRLGLATPGHIAAGKDSGFLLVLAQQSIREMQRTGRTAQQVMDEAVFGVFESGHDAGFGSDADHLKTPEDVDVTAAAGFISFTIDPSAHVDDTVAGADREQLASKYRKLIDDKVPGADTWRKKYGGKTFTLGTLRLAFDDQSLLRAAVKYGRAVAHVESMTAYIAKKVPTHEIELSVDETALPTSSLEHFFIANELKDRGVRPAAVAPRFIGEFEKGIDYKGDLKAFEAALIEHVEIARHCGPYKLSVHSGSDKFSTYPIVARVTGGAFHLKTAGTSYLEALRVAVRKDVAFFREVVDFCRGRFETDKASYHVSAELSKVPAPETLDDAGLERVYLDENAGRQVLHVTFGSVLTHEEGGAPKYRGRLLDMLNREPETYVKVLVKHIGRHLKGLQAGR
jgi:hypothetical protein